ncbi:Uncharacterised protein [Mycobacteroides abscessus subsp. abscessus]|nr:Uncharacterised protein [Mycobacteroides abscessus subsp. abscessus]SKY99748.1 Uncharacterised protein [Mycobacteroides abscessus subsp. abscessus]
MVAKSSAARTGSSSDKTVTPVDSSIRSVAAATAPSSTVGAEESTSPACRSPTAKESKPKFSANTAVSITLFSRSAAGANALVAGFGRWKTMSSSWKRILPVCLSGLRSGREEKL